jgi:predicted ATPase/class 3 adenylate cyclase/DNA-binding CsgD family transcriptional regulator
MFAATFERTFAESTTMVHLRQGGRMSIRTAAPTGVVTVLLGDVEGSVRLWEADAAEMAVAMAALNRYVDGATTAHEGYRPVEQGEGDSFVIAFERPGDAIAAALEIQTCPLSTHVSLHVRMAVHSQEAQLRDDHNYEGALMHRTARMRGLAHGGQVLVSSATRALVSDSLPPAASLLDLGSHHLRDIDEPERVFQLEHPDIPASFPPLRTPSVTASNLPAPITEFIGRSSELRVIGKLLDENRLVALTGAGGVGKTRLAVEAATQSIDRFPHGVWFVDLSVVADPSLVTMAAAGVIRARNDITQSQLDNITARLLNDAALLVFDNCEHVLGSVAALVDGILRCCSNVRVLVTSREPLNIGGEATFAVPPLALPSDIRDVDPSTLADYDAVRLFSDRANRADPSFELNARSLPIVASICQRVDSLPLAIELAAARLRVMSLDAIVASLTRRSELLAGGSRVVQLRQRSLVASIEWSHDLLDERERALLRRLSVFAGTFSADAVEAVCVAQPVEPSDVEATFLSLVDKSLVAREPGGRYRLLETIRAFAHEKLATSEDDEEVLRRRHLGHLVAWATRIELGDSDAWMAQVEEELADVDQAIAWATGADQVDALRVAVAVSRYAFLSFTSIPGLRRLDVATPTDASLIGGDLRAGALVGTALLSLICGDQERASTVPTQLAEALAIYERSGDRLGAARTRALQCALAQRFGPTLELRHTFDAAIADLRELGDDWSAGFYVAVWGAFLVFLGRPKQGLTDLREARDLNAAKPSEYLGRYIATWEATAHGMMGEHREAIELGQQCLAGMGESRDTDMKAFLLGVIGNGYWELGELDAAESYGRRAADLSARYGHPAHEALGHALVGRVAFSREDFERARTFFERAIDIVAAKEQVHLIGRHACWLAETNTALGRVDDARAAIAKGLNATSQIGQSADTVRLLLATARLEHMLGDDDAAEDAVHRALEMVKIVGGRQTAVTAFELLGVIAEAAESDAEAARLFGAAGRLRAELGRGDGRSGVELALARERLGGADFARACSEGEAMSLEEAIAYAARGRGARKRPSTGWASLTPTELEVIAHVAAGLTNPQIGEKMFIARGTVRTHLSHIFAKLGVSSRSQLASEFTRRA